MLLIKTACLKGESLAKLKIICLKAQKDLGLSCRSFCNRKTQIRLPATTKTKLISKRKEVYSGAATWETGGLLSQRPSRLPAQAYSSYRQGFFIYPIIFLAFGMLSLRASPCTILANEGDTLALPGLPVYVRDGGTFFCQSAVWIFITSFLDHTKLST